MSCKPTPHHQPFPKSGILARNLDVDLPGWESDCPETKMPAGQTSETGHLVETDVQRSPESSCQPNVDSEPKQSGLPLEKSKSTDLGQSVFAYVLTSLEVKNGKILQTGCDGLSKGTLPERNLQL
jgi:hypothetical protein